MSTGQAETPRLLTPTELAGVVRVFREVRQWSQETLAALTGLSVRTIQRVEKGEPSDFDTRRALARAFDSDDLDIFNKPYDVPSAEQLKAAQEQFEREHLILDAKLVTSGRELTTLFQASTMDLATSGIDLADRAATDFAQMVDYLHDFRDCAAEYTEVQKLEVFAEIQRYVDALDAAGISVCCATRNTKLVGTNWADKTPWPVTVVYLCVFQKSRAPTKIAVSRSLRIA